MNVWDQFPHPEMSTPQKIRHVALWTVLVVLGTLPILLMLWGFVLSVDSQR